MQYHNKQHDSDQMPEYQVFPRGSLLIMFAGILMIIGLIFVVILFSYGLSFAFQKNTVTIVIVTIIPLLAITVITPGFMITRGRSQWQKVIEVLNSVLIAILLAGVVTSYAFGDMGVTVTSLAGLSLVVAARFCYRSTRYLDGVEYYRRIWSIYRQRQNE